MTQNKKSVLIIYTGGTIGMIEDNKTGALSPFNFENLFNHIPEITRFDLHLESYSFTPLIDSSNMNPDVWIKLAQVIKEHYDRHNGFVILHGSDTMAYTASALSFMLENLAKPVILTGSQLPIGVIRTDGRENIVTAIEIASSMKDNAPIIPEVCIYFENYLYRGNRTHKFNAENFKAFMSANFPTLAEVGVHIKFNHNAISKPGLNFLIAHTKLDTNIAILKLFPGITKNVVEAIMNSPGLKGIVLETYGSGNAPTDKWFIELLKNAIDRGIIVLNVTQCKGGSVELGKYETSADLRKIGVVGGADITTEAAITKLMYLLGENFSKHEIEKLLTLSLRGELAE